jgi:hypothetical protein
LDIKNSLLHKIITLFNLIQLSSFSCPPLLSGFSAEQFVAGAVVLAVVYHYGYSAGRSAGIRTTSVMPQITSTPVSVPPAPITPEARQPKIVETPDIPPPMAKVFRPKSGNSGVGKGSESRLAPVLPSVPHPDKAVFRAPNVSGSGTLEPARQLPGLQPLKAQLPLLAKPQSPLQETDCGCGK